MRAVWIIGLIASLGIVLALGLIRSARQEGRRVEQAQAPAIESSHHVKSTLQDTPAMPKLASHETARMDSIDSDLEVALYSDKPDLATLTARAPEHIRSLEQLLEAIPVFGNDDDTFRITAALRLYLELLPFADVRVTPMRILQLARHPLPLVQAQAMAIAASIWDDAGRALIQGTLRKGHPDQPDQLVVTAIGACRYARPPDVAADLNRYRTVQKLVRGWGEGVYGDNTRPYPFDEVFS